MRCCASRSSPPIGSPVSSNAPCPRPVRRSTPPPSAESTPSPCCPGTRTSGCCHRQPSPSWRTPLPATSAEREGSCRIDVRRSRSPSSAPGWSARADHLRGPSATCRDHPDRRAEPVGAAGHGRLPGAGRREAAETPTSSPAPAYRDSARSARAAVTGGAAAHRHGCDSEKRMARLGGAHAHTAPTRRPQKGHLRPSPADHSKRHLRW